MAYTTATILAGDVTVNGDGSVSAVVTYTGDSNDPVVKFTYTANSLSAGAGTWLRGQAMDRIAILNSNETVLNSLVLPKVLDTTTPLPQPAASVFGSYIAASAPFTPGTTPTDVFGIAGIASRVVTVTGLWISTVQTTAGSNVWFAIKRSTLNTGGTSSAVTAVPVDSTFPAALAPVRQYTVNPTLGTTVGSIWSGRVASPAPATAGLSPFATPILGDRTIVLNGAAEMLALNFNGAALPSGLSVQAIVTWNETA